MISENTLAKLRKSVSFQLSGKRFNHVLGVEKAASYIGKFCLPESILELRAAALLHDITKELDFNEHSQILKKNGFFVQKELIDNPHLLHSFSAPYMVFEKYPEFSTPDILSAIEKHTLGSSSMSIFDEIIFIADYIEDGRTYSSCVTTRNFLYNNFNEFDFSSNRVALHKAVLMSIDFTIESLRKKQMFIYPRIFDAREAIFALIK